MITYSPRAARMPPIRALPYPRSGIGTTRAPASLASCWLPSVLPLSATTTSPLIPLSAMNLTAFRTQVATVSASLRHGITTVSSTWTPAHLRHFVTSYPRLTRLAVSDYHYLVQRAHCLESACPAQGGYGLE